MLYNKIIYKFVTNTEPFWLNHFHFISVSWLDKISSILAGLIHVSIRPCYALTFLRNLHFLWRHKQRQTKFANVRTKSYTTQYDLKMEWTVPPHVARGYRMQVSEFLNNINRKSPSELKKCCDDCINLIIQNPDVQFDSSFLLSNAHDVLMAKIPTVDKETRKSLLQLFSIVSEQPYIIQCASEIDIHHHYNIEQLLELLRDAKDLDLDSILYIETIIINSILPGDQIDPSFLSTDMIQIITDIGYNPKLEAMVLKLLNAMNLDQLTFDQKELLINLPLRDLAYPDDADAINNTIFVIGKIFQSGYTQYSLKPLNSFFQDTLEHYRFNADDPQYVKKTASIIYILQFMRSIQNFLEILFNFMEEKKEEIIRNCLLTLNAHYDEWSSNDYLRKKMISCLINPLSYMPIDVKNSSITALNYAIHELDDYTSDIIQQLINSIPNASVLPGLLYHLVFIQEHLMVQYELYDSSYNYSQFIDDLLDYSDDLHTIVIEGDGNNQQFAQQLIQLLEE